MNIAIRNKIGFKDWIVIFSFITFLSFVSSYSLFGVSSDFEDYRTFYDEISGVTKIGIIFHYQIGFELIAKIISYFTTNFKIFYFTISFVSIFPKIYLIYLYSKKIYISLLIYFLLVFPIFEYNQIRNGLALGILYLGINYLNQKKIFSGFLSILISISFHTSSIVIFIVSYFIQNLQQLFQNKLNKNNFIIFILIIISILILFQIEILSYNKLILKFQQGFYQRPGSIFSIRIILLSLVSLIGIKYRNSLSPENTIWLNISIFGIIIYYSFISYISISHRFVTTTFFPYLIWIESLPNNARVLSRCILIISGIITSILEYKYIPL